MLSSRKRKYLDKKKHEEVAYTSYIRMALNLLSIIKRQNKTAENPDSASWDMQIVLT